MNNSADALQTYDSQESIVSDPKPDEQTFPDELVFAFVHAVGTQYEPIQDHLELQLKQFGYSVETIKVSDLFLQHASNCGIVPVHDPYDKRVSSLMDLGNKLRELTKTDDIAARLAVAVISQTRPPSGARPRTAYILRSLKREEEVALLRGVYGSGFFLIAIYAPEQERSLILQTRHGVLEADARALLERDKDEQKVKCGQRTGETFALADVFVPQDPAVGKARVSRFLDLVFGCPFETPTQDEQAMFIAYSSSLRSGDLSRQVGAALTDQRGDVLSVGCNDVPQYGGGLYWPTTGDQRDYVRGSDANEKRRDEIIRELLSKLRNDASVDLEYARQVVSDCFGIEAKDFSEEQLKKLAQCLRNNREVSIDIGKELLRETPLFSLTEFGRTVHAEMDAILACGRTGRSPVGGVLYATTFPCHNCTRHIVAAGIRRVVYIEPYPKSLAFRLHFDSIVLNEKGLDGARGNHCQDKVMFEPFLGVGPRRYFDLFSLKLSSGREIQRKEKRASGDTISWQRFGQRPRVPLYATSYTEREKVIVGRVDSVLHSLERHA